MKCLVIGDALIPAKYFEKAVSDWEMFDSFESYSFLEDMSRNDVRNLVRKMETEYFDYCPVPNEVYEKIGDAEALFVHLFPVPESLIQAAPKLKYILSARGGLENIDVTAAKKRGISILNCPAHNAYAVAEYTIGLILAETRNIVRADQSLANGVWREQYPNSEAIPELRSMTIGIVGFGTIGRLVAERLKVFGCKILVQDPYVAKEDVEALGCEKADMQELLRCADVITLHGRIPADAPALIGKNELKQMKKTAYLINTARAVLVDTEALAEALRNHDIMGAAVDVYPMEPLPEDFPLLHLDNITLTNHRGGDTIDSYIKAPEMLCAQLKELKETGSTRFLVR